MSPARYLTCSALVFLLVGALVAYYHYRADRWGVFAWDYQTFHKRILQWQAEHPNITWAFWGVVWAIVLILLFWPKPLN